ncbi:hypothetical protein, partial [Frankia tisae]|uniref:hypothetical protein n=1 Tax=Frankia tisae TaxID=2950104 RepID=UPI0021C054B3
MMKNDSIHRERLDLTGLGGTRGDALDPATTTCDIHHMKIDMWIILSTGRWVTRRDPVDVLWEKGHPVRREEVKALRYVSGAVSLTHGSAAPDRPP